MRASWSPQAGSALTWISLSRINAQQTALATISCTRHIRRFQEPDFKVGEILLYGALLFHGINGIRILFVDFALGSTRFHKKLFWVFAFVIAAMLVAGAIPMALHRNVQPIMRDDALPGGL